MVLSEFIKEREAQLVLRRLKERASPGKYNDWLHFAIREYEQGIIKEQDQAHNCDTHK